MPYPALDDKLSDGVFTVVVMPDTQGYSHQYPDIFTAQTEWIAVNRDALNIEMVVHVGDLVEASWLREEWAVARGAFALLDGEVPYIIAPGNHDYGDRYERHNAGDRSTLFHEYFPRATFQLMPTFGGFFAEDVRADNSYQVFTVAGQSFLVIAMEFGPRDEVLDWAGRVLDDHPDHIAIVATHAYLYSDDTRYDFARKPEEQQWTPHHYGIGSDPGTTVNDGQEIWDRVIADRANVFAVVCGHVLNDGLGYAVSRGAGTVHEILANYQMHQFAGEGFLRLMHFDIRTRDVHIRTYSPWRDRFKRDPANQFDISY